MAGLQRLRVGNNDKFDGKGLFIVDLLAGRHLKPAVLVAHAEAKAPGFASIIAHLKDHLLATGPRYFAKIEHVRVDHGARQQRHVNAKATGRVVAAGGSLARQRSVGIVDLAELARHELFFIRSRKAIRMVDANQFFELGANLFGRSIGRQP